MKNIFLLFVLVINVTCCKRENEEESQPKPFRPAYLDFNCTTPVDFNDSTITKYFYCIEYIDSSKKYFKLRFESSDSLYRYYVMNISIKNSNSGLYYLHSSGGYDSLSLIDFYRSCCYTNPDAIDWEYVTDESDSLNNFIEINVDSIQKLISGKFKSTLIHFLGIPFDGPDTFRIKCDTFSCNYTIQ